MPINTSPSPRHSQALPPGAAALHAPDAQALRARSASMAAASPAIQAFVPPSQTPPNMPSALAQSLEAPKTVATSTSMSIDDVINTPVAKPLFDGRASFRRINNRQAVDLADMSRRQDAAKSVGVNVAKRSFYAKLGGALVVGLLTLGMVAAALVTAGAAMPVLAGLASLTAMRMGANAWCAKQMLSNAEAEQRGQPPPHDLPMGNDGLANLLYKSCSNSWSHPTRQKIASWGSTAASSALLAANLTVTAGAGALPLAITGLALFALGQIQQSRLDKLPTAEAVLNQDRALPGATAPEGFATESALPEQTRLEDRLLDQLFRLDDLKLRVDELSDPQAKQALAQDIAGQELKLAEQLDRLARQLEKPIFNAAREVSAGQGLVSGAGETTVEMVLDKGAETAGEALGTHGFALTGAVLNLAMVSLQLRSRQAELAQLQAIQQLNNPEIAALHQRHMELALLEDDADFEMQIDDHPPGFQPSFV
jgi:hypothetical protein